jgi:hypothetical protein
MTNQMMIQQIDERKAKTKERMKRWREENKPQINAYQKQWRERNAEQVSKYQREYQAEYNSLEDIQFKTWVRNLHKNYKITPLIFNEMWNNQCGKCAICKQLMEPRGRKKSAATVDHNHDTGKVRGLLCRGCNHGIGNLKDDPEVLRSAFEYLLKQGHYSHLNRISK